MINENFIFVAAVIQFAGGLSYLVNTIKGKTQPNRVSWLLWAVAPMIGFAAQIHEGVGLASLLTFMVGFNPAMVFIASFFNKKSVWKLGVFDYVCGAFSVLAIIIWQLTNLAMVAIVLSILADFFASIPTVVKAYRHPLTEDYKVYLGGIFGSVITLLALRYWSFQYYGFPIYIIFICVLLVFLIAVRPRFRARI